MIVIKRGKEPNSLLKFRKENPDADYESDMPTDVLKDIRKQMRRLFSLTEARCYIQKLKKYKCRNVRFTIFLKANGIT